MKKITFNLLSKLTLVLITIFSLTSCTIYKIGQTPDDMYYSPQLNRYVQPSGTTNNYTTEDIRLRHQMYDYRFRLLDYDDWYYQNRYTNRGYITFGYTYNWRYLNYNNWYHHNWYNPYFSYRPAYTYYRGQYSNNNNRRVNTPRVVNLNTYRPANNNNNNNRPANNNNRPSSNNRSAPIRVF